jgi:hypothetical protein
MVEQESRKFYRKETLLEGMYKKLTPPFTSDKMMVNNVSATGCRFDASLSHKLQPGDRIGITFTLNDARGTMIRKEATVKVVDGRYVGCQFIVLPGTYDPDLGFYLRSL